MVQCEDANAANGMASLPFLGIFRLLREAVTLPEQPISVKATPGF
jgi:hypothetical protein